MAYYYFFVAQLPSIKSGEKPSLDLAQFLIKAKEYLSSKDFVRLENALYADPAKIKDRRGVYGAWLDFNHQFRNQMAFFRAQRAGKNPLDYIRGEFYQQAHIMHIIHQAAGMNNPLDAEKMLDRARMDFLDEAVKEHYFDFDVVLAYALKLKMYERYQFVESSQGQQVFDDIKDKIKIGDNL